MAHDLVKFGLALAALILIALVMSGFVSGYLAAFKPGAKKTPAPASVVSGARSISSIPSPSPVPTMAAQYNVQGYPRYQPAAPQVYSMPPPAMMPEMPPEMQAAPLPTPTPQPVVPASEAKTWWYYLIQDLLKFFPGLFSGKFSAFPQWPMKWI